MAEHWLEEAGAAFWAALEVRAGRYAGTPFGWQARLTVTGRRCPCGGRAARLVERDPETRQATALCLRCACPLPGEGGDLTGAAAAEEDEAPVASGWVSVDPRGRVRSGVTGRLRSCQEALLVALELRALSERLERWAAISDWGAPGVPEAGREVYPPPGAG